MYECPTCGGNLKFDIARQQLYCEYCGTQVDPYRFSKERDAEKTQTLSGEGAEEYEVTVFTCPQCGSEILSEDTTAATFCSFCGAATILDSHISRERCPEYILPFTKTREDCRAAYGKMLRRALFAPKELKDETLIEKFRGIYMPYWVYSFEKKEPITFSGRKTRRRGDYRITDYYKLDCEIEEVYEGLAYDASSTFSDSLSSAIAPFDLREGKAFVPAFLSGFYADTSDVEKYVYLPEAEDLVIRDASQSLSQDSVCRKYRAGQGADESTLRNALRPATKAVQLAMLPVWFLSYRNGDRVSYAVVNGQTGRAAAELPVDEKKYLAGSLVLAVPLFFLLNLFFTITPGKILLIAALLAFLCIWISNRQMSHILARESGEDDKGISSKRASFRTANASRRRGGASWSLQNSMVGKVVLIFGLFYIFTFLQSILFGVIRGMAAGRMRNSSVLMIAVTLMVFASFHWVISALLGSQDKQRSAKKPFGGGNFRKKWPVLRKPLAGIVLAAGIWFWNPVSDWFYYIGAFVCMGTVLWAILDIIRQHNLLTTRKLPQLGRRGGDEIG